MAAAVCHHQIHFHFHLHSLVRWSSGGGGRVSAAWTGNDNNKNKKKLYSAVQGLDRGIFGAPSAKKEEIQRLVESLEAQNPTPLNPLCKVDGCWKLVYSTVSITGSKRTKLGLRGFITLGDFLQTIHVQQRKAINVINFNANILSGQLTIVASFTLAVASTTRVDIKYESSDISPPQLRELFQKNYDVLLAIFNPDGWLDITYLDESMRIGRDDKGNIFVLERFNRH